MADHHLQQFRDKVRQLNAFLALADANSELLSSLKSCDQHHQVVELARSQGFDIARRWGDLDPAEPVNGENLLSSPCPPAGEESTVVLQRGETWRLELIHSCEASSPPGFWYDQNDHEWVVLLQGNARLQFADDTRLRELCRGDSVMIPAHCRHRVVATDQAPGSVWLALFWQGVYAE